MTRRLGILFIMMACSLVAVASDSNQQETKGGKAPRVIVFGVNGAEWDILRPLLIRGELPNLEKVISNGVYGKLQTVSAPNCPKVYGTIYSGVAPEENGITGFVVGGITANTNMLKAEPVWSILSKRGVTVGMANVPATFPVMPVNGYMVSGMLTRGKGCEDGVLCAPKLSEVQGGDPVYPRSMVSELEAKVGDFYIDCSRMPSAESLAGKEEKVINEWLAGVQQIRDQQTKLFDYLLTNHPKDFTFLVQSCEDRVGHWLYPIQPHNVGYNPKINAVRVDAFPNQYRALDKVLGTILKHVDDNTYLFIISDHGIKPLRQLGEAHHDASHGGAKSTTPVIAKHDYPDGDDVPGAIIAMGPGIKKNVELTGFSARVFDIAPTLLHLYGIQQPAKMKGRVLTEIFESSGKTQTAGVHH
ncbi:MAG: alkaline phosphatase family protein [Acidobacteriales bacterium]|nr:alkaline phosphatase family protein [Terriglobales bacterium]